jgi:clan AA aspartic protease (TIGR02281 family)
VKRFLFLSVALIATIGVALVYADPHRVQAARHMLTSLVSDSSQLRLVEIVRGRNGDFAMRAQINGAKAPMVLDTGATSVILTYESAKAAGLPTELLNYTVVIETANGTTQAAAVVLDQLAIGKLVEKSVPALVVPRGKMKVSLLGMSFLDRLHSWEVQGDRIKLRGYP